MHRTKLTKEDLEKWSNDINEYANIALTSALKELDGDTVEINTNLFIDPQHHENTDTFELNDQYFTTLCHMIFSCLKEYRDKCDVPFMDLFDHIKKEVIRLQEFEK